MKKAILVGVDYYPKNKLPVYMDELRTLAETLDIETAAIFTQEGKLANSQTKIGSGKLDEIKTHLQDHPADLAIFNEELTGSQIRNLEDALDIPVIDRTLLILDIFAKRARTKEAMLQVEVAQLKYILPRLASLDISFGRQQGGIGSRGPGEKKIELDRRKIENDIVQLKKQLDHIVKVRQSNRKHRKKSLIKTVAVVGYTNAGKSTLVNVLLDMAQRKENKNVHVKDQLFATLETASRRIDLPNKKPFVLTDTIGFISNLPPDLVDSFKSTLEEIKEADLLIHVVDFSNPYYFYQIMTTQKVLEELGVDDIDTLYVFNKIDLNQDNLPHGFTPSVKISLTERKNIDVLIDKIFEQLAKEDIVACYTIPYDAGDIVNVLSEHSEILEQKNDENGTHVKARVSPALREQIKKYEV